MYDEMISLQDIFSVLIFLVEHLLNKSYDSWQLRFEAVDGLSLQIASSSEDGLCNAGGGLSLPGRRGSTNMLQAA